MIQEVSHNTIFLYIILWLMYNKQIWKYTARDCCRYQPNDLLIVLFYQINNYFFKSIVNEISFFFLSLNEKY